MLKVQNRDGQWFVALDEESGYLPVTREPMKDDAEAIAQMFGIGQRTKPLSFAFRWLALKDHIRPDEVVEF
jgi:hypothetical protein